MAVAVVYLSISAAGHACAWIGALPRSVPFRRADHVLEVGREQPDTIAHAALRLIIGSDLSIGHLAKKWAAADRRASQGRDPWEGANIPTNKPLIGEIRGRRFSDAALELFTADELRRIRELEIASDDRIRRALERARSEERVPFATKELHEILGIEAAIGRVFSTAFGRKHPPIDWEERLRQLRGDAPIAGGPFAVLGISPTKDLTTIRAAWKRIALQTHPDRGGDPAAFIRAKRAYDDAVRACGGAA